MCAWPCVCVCVCYPVLSIDLQWDSSSCVPGDGDVFTQKNDVILSRAHNLNRCLFQHGLLHPHLQKKKTTEKGGLYALLHTWCEDERCLFYLVVFHDNQSSHVQHCDAFTAAVACDPTSRVLHQNPKCAFQPVTVILLGRQKNEGKQVNMRDRGGKRARERGYWLYLS